MLSRMRVPYTVQVEAGLLMAGESDAAINYMHIEPRSGMRWMLMRCEHNIL